jgi:protein FrlC
MEPLSQSRFVIASYHYTRYPLEYFLDVAARLGYEQVELWAMAPQLFPAALDGSARKGIRRELAARSLKAYCLTPEQVGPPFNVAHKDETLRRMSIDYCKSCIDLASDLEAPHMIIVAGCGYYDEDHKEMWERSLASNLELAEHAAAKGIKLFYETLTPPSSNILNSPQQLGEMLSRLPGDIGGIADFGQIAFMKQDLADYTRILGGRLAHVHIHDFGEAVHMVLGEGHLPVASQIAFLEEQGYSGLYTIETNDVRYRKDPAGADEKSLRWLRKNGVMAP